MTQTEFTPDEGDERVQAAYDRCGDETRFIIADTTTDDAWLAVPVGGEVTVEEWA